jgi:hypothetical protein
VTVLICSVQHQAVCDNVVTLVATDSVRNHIDRRRYFHFTFSVYVMSSSFEMNESDDSQSERSGDIGTDSEACSGSSEPSLGDDYLSGDFVDAE